MSSASATWSCGIKLRYQYDGEDKPLDVCTTEPFGLQLSRKEDVEIWIRRAQAAILSPHLPPRHFLEKTEAELKEMTRTDIQMLPFSRNIVQVTIQDPDLPDLSFIDLPGSSSLNIVSSLPFVVLIKISGLIQNSDQKLINLVEELVVSHIEARNTLILATIPMSGM